MDRQPSFTPTEARLLAQSLLVQHQLHDWTFAFNRAKRSMGLCRHAKRRIELSVYYVLANSRESVRDTILHEIAHALAGARAGHGPAWKRLCLQIGATPERCGQARMPSGAWSAVCPGCRREYTRHRRPQMSYRYSCGDCGAAKGSLQFRPAGAAIAR